MSRREAGFSVTELLVVVGIMGIMSAVTAMRARNGPDDTAYRNAVRAVVSVARAASTAALANSTHACYLLLDTSSSSDRFVRGWVDLDDSGSTYSGAATDLLIGEYHLCKGSFMSITKSSAPIATGSTTSETWKFLPTGTAAAVSAGDYQTLLLCASKSKIDPANQYTSSSPTKWTTLTLTTGTNRIRECYQAFTCP